MKKVLLYSGGFDSYLIDKIWKPDIKLYIDVKGSYSEIEKRNLPENVIIKEFPIGEFETGETKFIPLRNLYFLMLASNYGETLCLGATAGDRGSLDKTPEFLELAENTINALLKEQTVFDGGHFTIERRFIEMTKEDLLREYLNNGGNIEDVYDNTFSCFHPDKHGEPCFFCKPCFRRFMALYACGYQFSAIQKAKMAEYVKTVVIPGKYKGTYYTERYKEGPQTEIAVKRFSDEMGL